VATSGWPGPVVLTPEDMLAEQGHVHDAPATRPYEADVRRPRAVRELLAGRSGRSSSSAAEFERPGAEDLAAWAG
jgi:hypothetical protein